MFLVSECQACQSNVYYGQNGVPPARCDSRVEDRLHRYGIDERCGFPLTMCRPVPVSDDTVLDLQKRVNNWLEGKPSQEDRQLVSLAAVLIPLLSPCMLRKGDPVLLYALRGARAPRPRQEKRLWTDPLRVAAAVCTAQDLLGHGSSTTRIAQQISDFRLVDHRDAPWGMDVMEWAYGPALRPSPYIDELVRLQVIIPSGAPHL